MYINDLSCKEVLNIKDGKILGFITDLEIDICNGSICALIVTENGGFIDFKNCKDIIIPWKNICKIGDDVVLVDISDCYEVPKEARCQRKKFKFLK